PSSVTDERHAVFYLNSFAFCLFTFAFRMSGLPFYFCLSLSRAAEAARAAFRFVEVFGPRGFGQRDSFDDELRDARARLDLYGRVAVVDEHAQHLAAIVAVNDARQRVEAVAHGQARARRDATVEADGYRQREARPHRRARAP